MATAKLSPSAHLLRKSRLFALPSALTPPKPPAGSRNIGESDTATLPFPIRAAIETTPTSLARGDWGLKRPLPSKSTTAKAVSPVVRINHLDTYEHVTDFESAGDHTSTLKKWQEMSIPFSTNYSSSPVGAIPHQSVFESSVDNNAESTDSQAGKSLKYRFKGPWLAGISEAEFQNFLKRVRTQKPEFLNKLRQHIAEARAMKMRRELMDQGKNFEEADIPRELSDAEFESALIALRADPSSLGPQINKFFDLATPPNVPDRRVHLRNWAPGPSSLSSHRYAQTGPPTTHPSVGLSYLRTDAHLDNHPIAGPQRHPRPIPARLLKLKQRRAGLGQSSKVAIGVGGIVSEDVRAGAFRDIDSAHAWDPEIPGGPKTWVKPLRASVQSDGRIALKVDKAMPAPKALYGIQEEQGLPTNVRKPITNLAPSLDR